MQNYALSAVVLLLLLTTGTAQPVKVRLVGVADPLEGRLEVYHSGRWGTVCDDYFTDEAARVVCHMLGYEDVGHVIGSRYGVGSGTIWLDNVVCGGTETNIENCRHRGWGSHNCGHDEDVSVSCRPTIVRLVGSTDQREGRLEVYYNGTWGTVCDDYFTNAAARVVCYMLGYEDIGRRVGNRYGAGSGPIWLDNVRCNGTETNITDCRHNGWGIENCWHFEDVSVSCTGDDSADATALVGGGNPRVGRLEVFHANQWGTVCDDGFTDAAARVVCYSLGFGDVGRKVDINLYGVGEGLIWLNSIKCWGKEKYVGQCSHGGWTVQNCSHHQDVAVSCIDNSSVANSDDSTTSHNGWGVHNCQHREDVAVSCASVQVRLNGGRDPREGRLEVLYNGSWGYVCDGGFNSAAARVVCNMLGFGYIGRPIVHTQPIKYNIYDYGPGPFWLQSVQCNGTERSIAECVHSSWGVSNCSPGKEQSVSCLTDDAVALFGGGSPRRGRLEVYHNGTWGTVCGDYFNEAAAEVVCYSLGFGYVGWNARSIRYGSGTGQIWLDDVRCDGMERHISECSHGGWGVHDCGHDKDVAVACLDSSVESTSNVSDIVAYTVLSLCFVGFLVCILGAYVRKCWRKCRTSATSGNVHLRSISNVDDEPQSTTPEDATPVASGTDDPPPPYQSLKPPSSPPPSYQSVVPPLEAVPAVPADD